MAQSIPWETLPVEIQQMIVDNVHGAEELKGLRQCSKGLAGLAFKATFAAVRLDCRKWADPFFRVITYSGSRIQQLAITYPDGPQDEELSTRKLCDFKRWIAPQLGRLHDLHTLRIEPISINVMDILHPTCQWLPRQNDLWSHLRSIQYSHQRLATEDIVNFLFRLPQGHAITKVGFQQCREVRAEYWSHWIPDQFLAISLEKGLRLPHRPFEHKMEVSFSGALLLCSGQEIEGWKPQWNGGERVEIIPGGDGEVAEGLVTLGTESRAAPSQHVLEHVLECCGIELFVSSPGPW